MSQVTLQRLNNVITSFPKTCTSATLYMECCSNQCLEICIMQFLDLQCSSAVRVAQSGCHVSSIQCIIWVLFICVLLNIQLFVPYFSFHEDVYSHFKLQFINLRYKNYLEPPRLSISGTIIFTLFRNNNKLCEHCSKILLTIVPFRGLRGWWIQT